MLTPEERLRKVFEAELGRGKVFIDEVVKTLSGIMDMRHSEVRVAKKYAEHISDELEEILKMVRKGGILNDKERLEAGDVNPLISCLSLKDIYNTAVGRFLRYVMPGREPNKLSATAKTVMQKYESIKTVQGLRQQMKSDDIAQETQDKLVQMMEEKGWLDKESGAVVSHNAFKAYSLFRQIKDVKSEADVIALRTLDNTLIAEDGGKTGASGGTLGDDEAIDMVKRVSLRDWVSIVDDVEALLNNVISVGIILKLELIEKKDKDKFVEEIPNILRSQDSSAYINYLLSDNFKIKNREVRSIVSYNLRLNSIDSQIQYLSETLLHGKMDPAGHTRQELTEDEKKKTQRRLYSLQKKFSRMQSNNPRTLENLAKLANSIHIEGMDKKLVNVMLVRLLTDKSSGFTSLIFIGGPSGFF